MDGAVAYHAGIAAEHSVARFYQDRGHHLRACRWRGKGGEIDLIFASGDQLIFVEVKKSRNFSRAVERFSTRQLNRICMAANEYVAGEPGQMDTDMRIDLALVDAQGALEVIENILH